MSFFINKWTNDVSLIIFFIYKSLPQNKKENIVLVKMVNLLFEYSKKISSQSLVVAITIFFYTNIFTTSVY